ncbi:MAG: TetR/AcrR family transcriptional regulator [Anaerolineae bacterium]|nr:TetR/AcrR family transcriptional regulator [Anaerolineae bacterium]
MIEARRTQILMGAAEVFSQKGFYQATTKEIAKAADVSEGTIYNYFKNKRDILVAMIDLLGSEALKGMIPNSPAKNPKEFLSVLGKAMFQLLQERGRLALPILAEIAADAELRARFYQALVRPVVASIEASMQRSTPSSQWRRNEPLILAYALVGGLLLNFLLQSTHLDPRYKNISADAIIEQLVSHFLTGPTSKELAWLMSS